MPQPEIAVSLGRWLAALVPLAVLLVLLVVVRWKAATAAPLAYFLAVLVALLVFATPARVVALQSVKGVWEALLIVYIILPALLLYLISDSAGAFGTLEQRIEAYTPNNLLQVLAVGWVFPSFLQGITGFGAPVAITAPLLVAIGVKPLWAVVIPLIGHCWANTFGTLAVAWQGLVAVAPPEDPTQTALTAAVMLAAVNLTAGFSISWLYGRGTGVREALPALLLISAIHGGGQLALVGLSPTLANFVPGTIALGAIVWVAHSRWYRGDPKVRQSAVLREGEIEADLRQSRGGMKLPAEAVPLTIALAPYVVLIGLIVVALLIPPVTRALRSFQIGLSFPQLETGLGVVTEANQSYRPFAPLVHPGTFLLIAAVVAYVLFRSRGYLDSDDAGSILRRSASMTLPSAMALLALVALSLVMEGSGQVRELALGVAAVAPGAVYAFLAPLVGLLGAFMTSSNLSSNILFGPLQQSIAAALGLSESAVLAAQTAGGAIGNSIAPGNILLGLGAVGMSGRAGEVLRRTIVFALATAAVAGLITWLAATFFLGGGA